MSLRSFLENTDEKNTVSKEVEPDYEVPSLISQDQSKPIIFESVKGYPDIKIVSNLVSSRGLIARSLGVSREEILFELSDAFGSLKECRVSEKNSDQYREVDDPEIENFFPVLKYYKKETEGEVKAPRYFASCMVIAKDPETNVQNLSFHRMMYHGGNRFTIRIVPRHLYEINERTEGDLEVAMIKGVDPRVEIAAATSGSPDMDELEYANSLMDEELNLVDINGLKVPESAETVMMGRITDKEDKEGPFVDLSETWDKERQQPVLEVDKLYLKNNPYIRVLVPGKNEHKHLMGLPQEPRIYNKVRDTLPTVQNVVMTQGGCSWLHGVVKIKKRYEGDGKNAGMAALAGHPSMKRVVIVGEDIDPSDSDEVEWSIATRVRPDKDITEVKRVKGSSLDPSQDYENRLMTKWIVDATVPKDKDENFSKAKIPGGENFNLDNYR